MHYSREPTNQSSHSYIFYMNVNITTLTCRVSAASVWRMTSLRSGTRGCHCDLSPPTRRSCSPLQPQLPGCRVLPESPVSSCNGTERRTETQTLGGIQHQHLTHYLLHRKAENVPIVWAQAHTQAPLRTSTDGQKSDSETCIFIFTYHFSVFTLIFKCRRDVLLLELLENSKYFERQLLCPVRFSEESVVMSSPLCCDPSSPWTSLASSTSSSLRDSVL